MQYIARTFLRNDMIWPWLIEHCDFMEFLDESRENELE